MNIKKPPISLGARTLSSQAHSWTAKRYYTFVVWNSNLISYYLTKLLLKPGTPIKNGPLLKGDHRQYLHHAAAICGGEGNRTPVQTDFQKTIID